MSEKWEYGRKHSAYSRGDHKEDTRIILDEETIDGEDLLSPSELIKRRKNNQDNKDGGAQNKPLDIKS